MFRGGDAPAASGAFTAFGEASAANQPFAWPIEDPIGRAMRASLDVVENAVRRGFGLGNGPWPALPAGPPWASAWPGGPPPGSWGGLRTTGQWVDAMTGAITQWAQWLDAWLAMVRQIMNARYEPAPGPWPPQPLPQVPPPSPLPADTSALRLTVELRTARPVRVELDLQPGSITSFEVHGLMAPAAAAAPPITDVRVAIVDGGAVVALGSIDQHPAGTYAGAVLAAGRVCGTLTVRLT